MGKKWIYIDRDPFEDDVVECCLNGRITLIKRGMKCLTDKDTVDLLRSSGVIFREVER